MVKYYKYLLKIIFIMASALLVLGCSHQKVSEADSNQQAVEEVRDYIKSLPDPERTKELLVHFEALNKSITGMTLANSKYGQDFRKLFFRYEATQEDFKTLLDDFNLTRSKLQKDFLISYFMMRELTSAEEWETLAEMEEEVLNDAMRRMLLDKDKDNTIK